MHFVSALPLLAAWVFAVGLALCGALHVVPAAFLASRAFTVAFVALFAAVAARLMKGRWHRLPLWAAVPATPVLALATLLAFVYLETPFWTEPGLRARSAPSRATPIFVVSHGWHTSLALAPAAVGDEAWKAAFGSWGDDLRAAPWIEFGWGDAQFFQAEETSLGMTLDAMVTPDPSVLHVAKLEKTPDAAFPDAEIVRLEVTPEDLGALAKFLAESYALGSDGQPVFTSKGDYGPESRFVAAQGLYYFPNTCNVWTARGLAAAGIPVTPALAVTSKNAMAQAARFGSRLR